MTHSPATAGPTVSTTETGRRAEQAVAAYLTSLGWQLVATNWRTRWCEIDLIMRQGSTISFIEVKYRQTDSYGDGLAYITPAKLRQMHFAAEQWIAQQSSAAEYGLMAVAVSGRDYAVTDCINID